MRATTRVAILAAILTISTASSIAAQSLRTYVNQRFGYRLPYPAELRMLPPPANNDGRRFVSTDGAVRLTVYGQNNVLNNNVAALRAATLKHLRPARVTYRRTGSHWFVVSGYLGNGRVFYHCGMVYRRGGAPLVAEFTLTYRPSASARVSRFIGSMQKVFTASGR